MNILNFSTFVFDLDGVIIDSEYLHYSCYKTAFKKCIDYDLEWDEYCKIHHAIDTSFEKKFPEKYECIYTEKNILYKNEMKQLELVNGFYDFFKVLLKHGKDICIVTDATEEIFNLISSKFPFLKKCNIIITRNNCLKRKPNSDCYSKILEKLPCNTENHDIIAFEDSYKGWTAAHSVIYNCILVNDEKYVYYDAIRPLNKITDYHNIVDFTVKLRFDYLPFYVSSKTVHREKWIKLQNDFPIVANWIHINKCKHDITCDDKETICDTIQNDVINSVFGILYLEKNEKDHIGSLIEIGLLLANYKKIYICGSNLFKDEVLFNFKNYLNFSFINNYDLMKIFRDIQYDMNEDYNNFKLKIAKNIEMQAIRCESKNKIIDYVVICASGKGTRLLPITQYIPKLLVNIDNLNILNKIVEYWRKYSEKFVIVIDSKYNTIVEFYLKLLNVQYDIINVDCNHGEENSYTLHKSLQNGKFTNKKILITWCDIFPESNIPENVFENNANIIFTYKNYGRYDAVENVITKKPYGNIIGIYYFASFNHLNIFEPRMDICDCYKNNFGDFVTFEIEKLTDIGDYQKLCSFVNNNNTNAYNTRYFNKLIDLDDTSVEKTSTCAYGNKIIINEMAFYKYITVDNIPEIIEFGENSFKMKKIVDAKNVIDVFNNAEIKMQKNIILQLLNEMEKIHNVDTVVVSNSDLLRDIRIEFYDKVLQRIDNVQPLLTYFNHITAVNDIQIKYNHIHIVEEMYENIKKYFADKCEYNTIHGDPHMSNILIDTNNKIWFIDPRGYFGDTKLFGPKEYDIGKIVYSLSGFDEINNNQNHFFTIDENNNISVNINNNIDNYLYMFDKYDRNVLIYMTILHWFGLTDYSKNNIHKCISSYYYGIYLYHLYYVNT
jgi:beta-phosphoglucomutase-like phosphatase (HAD superfamily)